MRTLLSAATPRPASSGKRSANSLPRSSRPALAFPAAHKGSRNQLSAIRPCKCGMRARSSSCNAVSAWKDLDKRAMCSDMLSCASWDNLRSRPMRGCWRSISICAGSGASWRSAARMSSFRSSTSGGGATGAAGACWASSSRRASVSLLTRSTWARLRRSSAMSSSLRECSFRRSCTSRDSRKDPSWPRAAAWRSERSEPAARAEVCNNAAWSATPGNAPPPATTPRASDARAVAARSGGAICCGLRCQGEGTVPRRVGARGA
mmetsp:Transcript_63647/g.143184  ORF Transcript_63647/g.143184 Transcript_63647/m.143184 type:complete len:263 (+) Transcript_63647:926-1714(+)